MSFYIQNTPIGGHHPPYIIAELSANHNGSLERAKLSMKAAKESGASAVKIQSYTADTMTIDSDLPEFLIKGGLWDGYRLYDLYKEAETPFEWHEELFRFAKEIDLTIFSSPFDETAVDMLEELNTPAYKIASFEIVDLPLIKYIAKKKKPLFMSTGMASLEEISEAVLVAQDAGCKQLALLHCVSGYPSDPADYNLLTLKSLSKRFNLLVGLSDHTISNVTANAAVALGAAIVEKHFTLDRNGRGPDDSFSMEPSDLVDLCFSTKITKLALGAENYAPLEAEKLSVEHRRSLYFVKSVSEGQIIDELCVRSIRPGNGLKPKYLNQVIGKRASRNIEFGTPVSFDDLLS